MPGGDKTGPAGMGPMTGRRSGYCTGLPAPGFSDSYGRGWGWGRGWGRGGGRGRGGGWGRGWGWGQRNWFRTIGMAGWQRPVMDWSDHPPPFRLPIGPAMTAEQELDVLKGQLQYFENGLEGIRKRIQEVESQMEDTSD